MKTATVAIATVALFSAAMAQGVDVQGLLDSVLGILTNSSDM